MAIHAFVLRSQNLSLWEVDWKRLAPVVIGDRRSQFSTKRSSKNLLKVLILDCLMVPFTPTWFSRPLINLNGDRQQLVKNKGISFAVGSHLLIKKGHEGGLFLLFYGLRVCSNGWGYL